MDQIDLNILYHLQNNARLTMIELGKLVGLSSPSVTERVKRLEEQSIITKYSALISPEKLNKNVTAYVLVEPNNCQQFAAFASEHPEVIECHRIAGMYSYITKIITTSVHTLENYINECTKLGRTTTLIVLSSPLQNKPVLLTEEDIKK